MEEIEENFSPERAEKQKQWDEIVAKVEMITDRLGMPIDEKIKETVIALKAMEINPIQSCEGHLDRGVAAPWIDIADKEAEKIMGKINWRERPTEEEAIKERETILADIERKNLELQKRIMDQLIKFYETRTSPFDQQLILQNRGRGAMRLESQGSALQKIADQEVKAKKLAEYQKEMKAFTEFLKEAFFETK